MTNYVDNLLKSLEDESKRLRLELSTIESAVEVLRGSEDRHTPTEHKSTSERRTERLNKREREHNGERVHKPRTDKTRKVLELLHQGKPVKEVAKRTKVTPNYVYVVKKRYLVGSK